MAPIIFLKAKLPGAGAADLFAQQVDVKGYVNEKGTYVAPHRATRKKHAAHPEAPDLFSAPPAPAAPASDPAQASLFDHADKTAKVVPEAIKAHVRRALAILADVEAGMDGGRKADTQFSGNGRYEVDAYENLANDRERGLAMLAKFRELATKNGVDGEAIINSLGGEPKTALSETGQAYLDDSAPKSAKNIPENIPEPEKPAETVDIQKRPIDEKLERLQTRRDPFGFERAGLPVPGEQEPDHPEEPEAPTVEKDGPTVEETIEPAPDHGPVADWGVPPGTTKGQRIALNQAAINILNAKTDADMTAADCAALAKYTGRGGCGDSLNEYYTDPAVASAMWTLLETYGFAGGDVLEPSAGTGVFMHTAPDNVRVTGVELDGVSARIGGILAGTRHDMKNLSLERFATQDPSLFDAVIGNPPYGLRGSFLRDDKQHLSTAEQYFVDTSLDKAKDNGLIALVVPTGIMDSKTGAGFRKKLLRKGEFLTGFRLPNTAFEASHTEVTTDILLFRKRPQPLAGALSAVSDDVLKTLGLWNQDFVAGKWMTSPERADHVMGTLEAGWRAKAGIGDDITVAGSMDGVAARVAAYRPEENDAPGMTIQSILEAAGPDAREAILSASLKTPYAVAVVGDVKIENGVRYILQGNPPRWHKAEKDLPNAVRDAVEIGDAIAALADGKAKDPDLARINLAEALDDYIRLHGLPTKNREMREWLAAPSLPGGVGVEEAHRKAARILGAVRADGTYSDLVTGERRGTALSSIETAATKLALEEGGFTVAALAATTGGTPDETLDWLFANGYAVDADGVTWTSMDQYLSGELWPKYDAAVAAAAHEGVMPAYRTLYENQVKALEEAIAPQVLEDVDVRLNSGFIEPADIAAWMDAKHKSRMENSSYLKPGHHEVTLKDAVYAARFVADRPNRSDFGTLYGDDALILKFLNRDGVKKDDQPAIERINREFATWLCGSEIRPAVEDRYNRLYRGFRQREYSDAPFDVVGMSGEKRVNNYIYSGLRWALEAGKGIVADDVGLGKTVQGLILARLAKSTGKANKPVIVVPKSVLTNWVSEANMWFPGCKVLVIGETLGTNKKGQAVSRSDNEETRRQKYHDMQQNDYDFVFVSKPAWNDLDIDPETKNRLMGDDFWVKRQENLKGKQLEKARAAAEQAAAKREFKKHEKTIYFDNLGIDMMIMDEGHSYKNLFEARNRFGQNPKFLGAPSKPAKTAVDMLFKSRLLRERTGGKGVYMLTATPTKNSPLEVYSMLSHIAPEAFERMGIKNQEDFLDRFVEFKQDRVLTVQGTIEDALVTAGFKHMDELREVMRRYINRRTAEQVGLQLPKRNDHDHAVDLTAEQEQEYASLRSQAAEANSDGEGDAHIFSIISKMDKTTLDMGLLRGDVNSTGYSPKLKLCADTVAKLSENGGQIVFCDSKEMHQKIADAIAASGVPREKIGVINADETSSSGDRQKVVDAFNDGKLMAVVGNTATMGEGLNMQKRTTDIHHLSFPWTPSEMQQRNGRGLRQGNTMEGVGIHNYMANRSFDGYRLQTLAAKKDWQDLLWNGGDRVENLAREGKFDRNQLMVMMSADPEAAAKEMAGNMAIAEQQRAAQARGKAAERFAALMARRKSLAEFKGDMEDPAWRAVRNKLENQILRYTDMLRADADFSDKDLLDSPRPALIDLAGGNVWAEGHGFEMPPKGNGRFNLDKPSKWVITGISDDGEHAYIRPYGGIAHFVGAVSAEDLEHATKFTPDLAYETAERERLAGEALTDNLANITHESDLKGIPESALHRHHDAIQAQLRSAAAAHRRHGYGDVLMREAGNFVPVESYNVNKVGIDKPGAEFLLPTEQTKKDLQEAYVNHEHGRTFQTHYESSRGRNRNNYGSSADGIEAKYPGASFNEKGNRHSSPLQNLFDETALNEAKKASLDRAVSNVAAAKSWPHAFGESIRGTTMSAYDRKPHASHFPRELVEALRAKATELGAMDQPMSTVQGGYPDHMDLMPHKFAGAALSRDGYSGTRTVGKFLNELRPAAEDPA